MTDKLSSELVERRYSYYWLLSAGQDDRESFLLCIRPQYFGYTVRSLETAHDSVLFELP